MNASRQETRQHILDTGRRLIAGKGFTSVGLNEILLAASVPKGSFYHYFGSKEQYGCSLLESYFDGYLSRIDALLDTATPCARERLIAYWQQWMDTQCDDCLDSKCLVVKLSAEVADLSESMRRALHDGTNDVIARIGNCIDRGVADQSLPMLDGLVTAQMLYQLWLGASLLGKIQRSRAPLDQAMVVTLTILSGGASASVST